MKKNDILITYGSRPDEMAKEILAAAKIEELIGSTDKRIGLKPNLVVAAPASTGATTHPEILAGTIEYLQERGYKNITILEGSKVIVTKNKSPAIHFVIRHPKMCAAIENMVLPVVEAQPEERSEEA